MELPSHFQKFLSNVEPTNNQKAEASTGHAALRSRLEKDDEYKTYFQDSFLSGSYGRDTAVRPIRDVDIIIVGDYPEICWKPELALFHLRRILSKYYDNLTTQNRSIHVALSYVEMDIVPAIKAKDDFLKIPDRALQNWVISNPRKHIELSTAINTSRNGWYKPLVKALKCWQDNRMDDSWKPKSFLLECLVYDYATNSPIDSIPKAMEGFFWFIHNKYKAHREANRFSPVIFDIGGTGNDVAKKWTYQAFSNFMDEVYHSWSLSYQALASQNEAESIDKWRQLLGDAFPVDT